MDHSLLFEFVDIASALSLIQILVLFSNIHQKALNQWLVRLGLIRYQLLLFQWLHWFSFWNWGVPLVTRTYILKIWIMSLLMCFWSRLFLGSWLWWSSNMFWIDIFLSIFFIWRNRRKRCPRRLLITRISRSYGTMLPLFRLIFIYNGLSLFRLVFMFDNNLDLLFRRHT